MKRDKSKGGREKLSKDEKRVRVQVFPKGKHIKAVGGIKNAKAIALNAIENHESPVQWYDVNKGQ